jgi:hypothetical protein
LRGYHDPLLDGNVYAPIGRLFCDSPKILIDRVLQTLQEQHKKERLDFILITGDLVAHTISQDFDLKNHI